MSLATFAGQALADLQSTAAIAPSSRFLAQAMVEPVPSRRAKAVVEFGPGTGAMTRKLLAVLPSDARLLAFEVNPRFIDYLRREIRDPRLEIVPAGAEEAAEELERRGWNRVDAVVSSLGLGWMEAEQHEAIFTGLAPFLDERSVVTQFQYVHRIRIRDRRPIYFDASRLLRRYFAFVERRLVVRNLPPAFVYECRRCW